MADDSSERFVLLNHLADEFAQRFRRGERPSLQEYVDQHPDLADDIREFFPAMAEMERVKEDHQAVEDPLTGAHPLPLERLGDYRLIRVVGRGGMGLVYEAEQISLGRHVALKVLPGHNLLDPRQLQRFHREARSAARLHHTNIVPVYGVGEHEGQHYYIMQFIQGLGLHEVLVELKRLREPKGGVLPSAGAASPARPQDVSAVQVARSLRTGSFGQPGSAVAPPTGAGPDLGADASRSESIHLPGQSETSSLTDSGRQYWLSVARVGIQVAGALAYASQQGILHRDIKPSNLLLDDQGNVWVTDFGLAKAETDGDNLTHTGDIVGTLRYMAPERFNGKGDVRSDLYSLGLTLYELLTLRPGFEEADRNRLIKQVMHDEPPRPRKVNPAVPRDLETVVLKATAREPTHRYQTPAEMADDLKRFLEDRPIRARQASEVEKFLRWCRRNPMPAGLLAALVLVFLAGFAGVVWQWRGAEAARQDETNQRNQAEALRQVAEDARARAEADEAAAKAARERAEVTLYDSHIARAQLEYRANNVADAETILERCPAPRRGWEWHFLKQLCHADLFTRAGHTGWVRAVAYSPDGRYLASAGGGNPFADVQGPDSIRRGEVILWDAATGSLVRTLRGHKHQVMAVAFSPDGKRLASSSTDGTARVWDVATGKEFRVFSCRPADRDAHPPKNGITSVAFSPDGQRLATGYAASIDVWDLTADARGPSAPKQSLRTNSPNDTFWIAGLAFSPDGRRLAAKPRDAWLGKVRVWDLATGREDLTLEATEDIGTGLVFSPDGHYLAAAGHDSIKLWHAATGRLLQSIGGHRGEVQGVAFSPDGRQLASAGSDGTVRVCHVPDGKEIRLLRGHRGGVRGVAFNADGMRLASGGQDGTVKVWDLTFHPEHADVLGGDRLFETEALAFADRGARLVLAQRGGQVRTLDCDSHAEVGAARQVGLTRKWLTPAEPACLDADGRWLAGVSGDDPRVARCWNVETGQERAALRGHTLPLCCVTLSSGARRIATGGRTAGKEPLRSEVKVWDGADSHPLLELNEPNLAVWRLALSADGRRLALAAQQVTPAPGDKEPRVEAVLRIYDLDRRELMRSFTGNQDPYLALAFSPDGARLAAAGFDGRTVLLWDLAAECPTVTHQGPEGAMDAAFSPDGRRLAIASRLMIKLLDAGTGEEVLILRGLAHVFPDTNGFNPRVRFSPDGKRLAAVCHDFIAPLSLWSVEEEPTRDQATRLRAADRRAAAMHAHVAHDSHDPKQRATFLFHLKWLQGLALASPEECVARGRLYVQDGQWERATADFARATALAPDKQLIHYECGATLAAEGRWDLAAPYFAKYFALGQGIPGSHWTLCVPLYLNDQPTYRRQCRQLLERVGQERDPHVAADILYLGLLASETGGDPEVLRPLVDRCLTNARQQPDLQWTLVIQGMAEYRAGRLQEAIDSLRKAEPLVLHSFDKAAIHFFLAMAYHRLHRSDEAKAAYQQALRHMEEEFGTADRFQPGKVQWPAWPWCQVLRREAEVVLAGKQAGTKP